MIRLLVLDVDGVLTDGTVVIDETGREQKTLFFRDLDAVSQARSLGLEVALLSGEETGVLTAIARRLGVDELVAGRKDKADALRELADRRGVGLAEVCYVGDADRDAQALREAGLGLAPADASRAAREAADVLLGVAGGRGVVEAALVELQLRVDHAGDESG